MRTFKIFVIQLSLSLFVLVVSSCKRKVENSFRNLIPIEVVNPDSPLKIMLSDLIDSVFYVPLETTDSCLIGNVQKIERDRDCFFVQDTRGIYVFDKDGHFLNEIGHRGMGPEEYVYVKTFHLDRNKKQVYLICSGESKMKAYGYDGHFVESFRLDPENEIVDNGLVCGDHRLLAHYPLSYDSLVKNVEYRLLTFGKEASDAKTLLKIPYFLKEAMLYPTVSSPIVEFEDRILLISALSDVIYQYKNEEIVPYYYVDMPNIVPSPEFLEENKETDFRQLEKLMRERNVGSGITGIDAVGNYLFMEVSHRHNLVWDGKKAISIARVINSDLDLITNVILHGGVSDKNIGYYDADYLCNHTEALAKSSNKKLLQIAESLHEDDNPVLYLYTYKTNLVDSLMAKYGVKS